MTQTIITEVLKYLIPTVLSFLIGWLSGKIRKMKQAKEEEDATRQAVVWILRWVSKKALIEDAKYFLDVGITPTELKDFKEAYENYQKLGGNGEAEIYYNKVMKLEVKVDESK